MRYDDRLFLLSIDVEDTAEHRAWIAHFKSHLLQRFQQIEMWTFAVFVAEVALA